MTDFQLSQLLEGVDLGAVLKFKLLSIRGVEITQGIQYYRAAEHLTDSADRGPDNSVRLVAGKPAWLRVYLRAIFGPLTGVTGTVRVFRRSLGFLWAEVGQLTPQPPGTATAHATIDYATERGSLANTLNFVVPADLMCGHLRFDVEVTQGGLTATRSVTVDVTLRQTLRMRIVPISYDATDAAGNPLTLPASTLADAQTTAAWSLLVYPVESTPDISLTSEVELTFPLTGSPANPGGCAQSWINLNALVAQAKTADGNLPDIFYYGLVPAAVPIGANSGCASSGVTSGMANSGVAMAHEFGHALGYPHAPCGSVGGGDPNYPAYEPYDPSGTPGASIGEYGLDISNGAVKSPATSKDYMSYCGPRWISLFNYRRAVDHQTLDPVTVCNDRPWFDWDEILIDKWWWLRRRFPLPDPPPWFDEVVQPVDLREPVISVIGVRHLTGEVEVRSITRTRAVPAVQGTPTVAVVELVGGEGQRLAAAAAVRLPSAGDHGCGGCAGDGDERGPYLFQAMVPDVGKGQGLRMVEDGKELWRIEAPAHEPDRPAVEAKASKRGVELRWKVGKGDEGREVWVRWRPAQREEYEVLLIATGSGRRRVEPGRLPAGEVVFDAVVHDGFHAAASEPVRVKVADSPPTVAILHPYDRRTVPAGETIRLQGLATGADGHPVDGAEGVWQFDGKDVATGLDVFVPAPEAGEHVVRLSVRGRGGRAEASVRLTTVDTRGGR